jgi:hypothetical protein
VATVGGESVMKAGASSTVRVVVPGEEANVELPS